MFNVIEKITEQVRLYSTYFGQLWYLIVFLFRLIVVVTIGASVYSDEQSAFRCSTKIVGCENVCYNQFAKISHLRFWAFQILALSIPVVAFHFYSSLVQEHVERYKKDTEKIESKKDEEPMRNSKEDLDERKAYKKNLRRRKFIGRVEKERIRFNKENKPEVVVFTSKIRVAYFVSAFLRFAIEFVFLYFAFVLFHFATYTEGDTAVVSDGDRVNNFFDLFWIEVPQLYRCSGQSVQWACSQHLLPGSNNPYVPCWVSRAWEKSIFLCYMNTLSALCLLLCLGELLLLTFRMFTNHKKRINEKVEEEKMKESGTPNNGPLISLASIKSNGNYVSPIKNSDDANYVEPETKTISASQPERSVGPENPDPPSSEKRRSANSTDVETGSERSDPPTVRQYENHRKPVTSVHEEDESGSGESTVGHSGINTRRGYSTLPNPRKKKSDREHANRSSRHYESLSRVVSVSDIGSATGALLDENSLRRIHTRSGR